MLQIKQKNITSFLKVLTIFIFGIVSTLGSGGGGGGGTSGPEPLVYSGNSDPATISLANAATLIGNVLFGGASSTSLPTSAVIPLNQEKAAGGMVITSHLNMAIHNSLINNLAATYSGFNNPAAVVVTIDQSIPCDTGYFTMTGSLDNSTGPLTGIIAYNYVNCSIGGVVYNGQGNLTIYDWDLALDGSGYWTMLNGKMSFTLLSMTSSDFNGSMSGSVNVLLNIFGPSETDRLIMNLVAKDNNTGKMYKFENMDMEVTIDDKNNLNSSGSISINRIATDPPAYVYDSEYGYITARTPTALYYSDLSLPYPDNLGDEVFFTGNLTPDNNGTMLLTVLSGRHVMLELDIDNAAGYEDTRYVRWEEFALGASTDLTDTDLDGMHDSWETLFGLDPNVDDAGGNLDGDGLTNLEEYLQGYIPNDASSPPPP